ncbi:hypothetical protein [Acuticoccus sediminis]|uniref:hypothetical protein n=1 Tax=Acuticoccus sediminis TaxID=2184697 RepID=UPI001CFDCD6F|nr:hypothetical protein [Acuticoccus sediminis]
MGIVESILGRSKSPPTSSSIRAELGKAETAAGKARTELADAQDTYRRSLLDEDPAATAKAKAAVSDAEVAVDRAEALIGALRQRFEAQCETEAEDQRREIYAAAIQQKAKAEKYLAEYTAHAEAIAKIIADVAAAERAISEANDDRPAGAAPIEGVEASVRHLPPLAPETLSENVADAGWHELPSALHQIADTSTLEHANLRLNDADQARVRPTDGNAEIGIVEGRFGRETVVVRRRRRVATVLPAVGPATLPPLAASVSLPNLRAGAAAFWTATHGDPADHADRLAAERARPAVDPRHRQPETSSRLVEDAELLAGAAAFARSRGAAR